MKHHYWKVMAAIIAGVVMVCIFSGCDNILGNDNGGGGGSSVEYSTERWIEVLANDADGPAGVTFRAALAAIEDSQVTIIYYDADTTQIAGLRGTYEEDGNTVDCSMNERWFPEDPASPADPQNPTYTDTPDLNATWGAIDWYEVVAQDVITFSLSFEDTTFSPVGASNLIFDKVTFSRPDELEKRWENGSDFVDHNADGSFTYDYDGAAAQNNGGGPLWEASGTTEGYMRQVYDDISDEEPLNYKEYLCPFEMPDADTLRFFYGYDTASVGSYDYTAAQ